MRYAGCKAAAMEVSSHALMQERVRGVEFDAAIFTNLTQDHLDYHKTMEAYFEAKALLFTGLAAQKHKKATAIINARRPLGRAARRADQGVGAGDDLRPGRAGPIFARAMCASISTAPPTSSMRAAAATSCARR